MFGIGFSELFFIIILAIVILPAKSWPDVFRYMGKLYRKVSDLFGEIKSKISEAETELNKHDVIDDISKNTFDDVMNNFSEPVKTRKKAGKNA